MVGRGTPIRRSDVLWRRLVDGVLIRRRGQEPIVLTGSGLSLWLALERPSSIDDLARRLAADHGTDPETVRSDIEPVIDDLVGRGVLRGG